VPSWKRCRRRRPRRSSALSSGQQASAPYVGSGRPSCLQAVASLGVMSALVPFDVLCSRAPWLDVTAVEGQDPLSRGQPWRWGASKTLKQRRCAACVGLHVDGERTSPNNGSNLEGACPILPQAAGQQTPRDGSTSNGTSAGFGRPHCKPLLQLCGQQRALRLREVPVRIAHTPSYVLASRARLPTPLHRGAATVAAPAFQSHGTETVAPIGSSQPRTAPERAWPERLETVQGAHDPLRHA